MDFDKKSPVQIQGLPLSMKGYELKSSMLGPFLPFEKYTIDLLKIDPILLTR